MSNSLKIKILDKEYQVACQPEDRAALEQSAELLNEKMQEVRRGGAIIGLDRIAVMTALNLAYELITNRDNSSAQSESAAIIDSALERVEAALDRLN